LNKEQAVERHVRVDRGNLYAVFSLQKIEKIFADGKMCSFRLLYRAKLKFGKPFVHARFVCLLKNSISGTRLELIEVSLDRSHRI
jgi:hypothetical protein